MTERLTLDKLISFLTEDSNLKLGSKKPLKIENYEDFQLFICNVYFDDNEKTSLYHSIGCCTIEDFFCLSLGEQKRMISKIDIDNLNFNIIIFSNSIDCKNYKKEKDNILIYYENNRYYPLYVNGKLIHKSTDPIIKKIIPEPEIRIKAKSTMKLSELQTLANTYGISIKTEKGKNKTKEQLIQEINI